MNYWKGLLIAAVFDVALITGIRFLATEPPSLGELNAIGRQLDSLMGHLQANPEDVAALRTLARLYADHGWWEDAIGPLARARALAPHDAAVVRALDLALKRSGWAGEAGAARLTQWAAEFVEVVNMWGHGC